MKIIHFIWRLIIVFVATANLYAQPPKAPSRPVTETYFGKQVTDPYRNLENLSDSAVMNWMKAQSDYTQGLLNELPGRQRLLDMMKEFNKRKPVIVNRLAITNNDLYFYLKTTSEDETAKLYMRSGYDGNEILLYEPAAYSNNTQLKYVMSNVFPNHDGSRIVIKIAANGSESAEMVIMNVKERKIYPEKIDRWIGPVSWLPGNKAFLFTRNNSSDVHNKDRAKNTKVFLHNLGTDASTDKEFFSATKYPDLGIRPEESPIVIYNEDSHYLFARLGSVDNRENVFYAPVSELDKPAINWKRFIKSEDEVYDFIVTEKELYFYTPKNAPNFKILKTSLQQPDLANASLVIAEDASMNINSFKLTRDGLYYVATKNGVEAYLYYLSYKTKKAVRLNLPLPAGNISLTTKTRPGAVTAGHQYSDIWVTIGGWTSDAMRFRYLPDKNEFKLEPLSARAIIPGLADLVVEEIDVTSHDGVKVPLSLIYKKGIKKDGNNLVMLNGYGAYGISMNPSFVPPLLLWVNEGGIAAIAHVRGGGELGEKWHKGGFKTTKPNTWKDMISCAEYLINNKYTSPQKLGINGGSAGGILVGRAITERPDLFAVAIPEVGVMNPLRFEQTPNGPANVPEFGTTKDSVECMALIEMDSYLHLKEGEKYPAILITAGMNDPRVIAWQPAKFAARMQVSNASGKPILFKVNYGSGHGIGDVKSVIFERTADQLSFALWQLGHPDFQIKDKKAF